MKNQIIKISPELLEMIGTQLPNSLMPFSREIFLLDIVVAGTTHCKKIDKVYPLLEKDMILRMQRHPKNRELNLVISRLMDAGKAFFCRVENVSLVNDYWVKIEAKIYMVE